MAVTVDGAEAATATAGRPWELDGCRLGFFFPRWLGRSVPSPSFSNRAQAINQ